MLKVFKHKVVQGTMWYSLVGLLTSGMSVVLLPVMTRWMNPKEFGILNSAIALSQLILPFATVGLGAAVVRYYHVYLDDDERFKRFFSSAFWFQIAVTVVLSVAILLLFAVGGIHSVAGVDLFHILPVLLLVMLNPPRDLGNQLLTSQEKHGRASVNQLVAFATATGLSLWLIGMMDWGASGRLYGRAAGAFAAALMLIKLPELRASLRPVLDLKELRVALKFGAPYVPYAFAMAGMLTIDKLILQRYDGLESVGVYSAAKTVAMGMSFIFVAVTRAWYPRYFALRDAQDEGGILRGQWGVLCLLPLTVIGFVILAPLVFPLMVGEMYRDGAKVLPVLALAMYGYGLFMTQANYINYLKRTIYLPFIAGLGVLVNFLMGVYWVQENSYSGVAWASVFGYATMTASLIIVSLLMERRMLERFVLPCISVVFVMVGIYLSILIPECWGWLGRLSLCALSCVMMGGIWWFGGEILQRKIVKCLD